MSRSWQIGCAAALALMLAACGQTTEAPPPPAPDSAAAAAPSAEETAEFCAEVGRNIAPSDCRIMSRLASGAERGTAAFNAPDPMQRGDTHMLQLAIAYAPPAPPPAPTEAVSQATDAESVFAQAQATNTVEAYRDFIARFPDSPRVDDATQAIQQLEARTPSIRSDLGASPGSIIDGLPGVTREFTPLVGRFMRAELVGDGFQIEALTPAQQEVLPDSVTTWNWRVTAQQGGARVLTLRTVVEGCTGDGQCFPLRSTSQNYDVNVEVSAVGKARDFLTTLPDWMKLVTGVLTALAALIAAIFGVRSAFRKGRSEA